MQNYAGGDDDDDEEMADDDELDDDAEIDEFVPSVLPRYLLARLLISTGTRTTKILLTRSAAPRPSSWPLSLALAQNCSPRFTRRFLPY